MTTLPPRDERPDDDEAAQGPGADGGDEDEEPGAAEAAAAEAAGFAATSLRPELKTALANLGFTNPMPVQAAVLEAGLERDLVVQARTGSGKTLAFGLPILDKLAPEARNPKALVLAPTRELALQIAKALAPLAEAVGARCVALTGGAGYGQQLAGLRDRRGQQLIVGTPGRVRDHLEKKSFVATEVETVVLDEGDQLLDMGFEEDLDAIIAFMPAERRNLLFSATIPPAVERLVRKATKDARRLDLDSGATPHADIEHLAIAAPAQRKAEALANLLLYERPERTVVFCATRQGARELAENLPLLGIPAGLISGELDQSARNRALDAFRAGRCHVLVATDVAARGIDVPDTTHVVHASLPGTHEAYVHRSGRTGRAGRRGVAISLVAPGERQYYARLTRSAGVKPRWISLPDPEGIRRRRVARLVDRLLAEAAEGGTPTASPEATTQARRLALGLALGTTGGAPTNAGELADAPSEPDADRDAPTEPELTPVADTPPAPKGARAKRAKAEAAARGEPVSDDEETDKKGSRRTRRAEAAAEVPGANDALVARLLDVAASLEGDAGFDLKAAIQAEAEAAMARERRGGPSGGRFERKRWGRSGHRGSGGPGHRGGPGGGRDNYAGPDERGPPRGYDRGPPRGYRDDRGPPRDGPRPGYGPGPRPDDRRPRGPADEGPGRRGPPPRGAHGGPPPDGPARRPSGRQKPPGPPKKEDGPAPRRASGRQKPPKTEE